MGTIGNQGSQATDRYALYEWNYLAIYRDSETILVGSIKSSELAVNNEIFTHVDNSWPPKKDLILPILTSMTFKCNIEEIDLENMEVLLDLSPVNENVFYVGDDQERKYFSLTCKREFPGETGADFVLEGHMYKAYCNSDAITIASASATEVVSIPFSCEAVKDTLHNDRLGYIVIGGTE